jgi:predicted regulator of Ras-like GTPase activity (Roadblock/LC7/MglB family)
VDGKLILQGAEDGYEKMRDGLGWAMVISEESGQVVLTASGEQVAFVMFGAALPF